MWELVEDSDVSNGLTLAPGGLTRLRPYSYDIILLRAQETQNSLRRVSVSLARLSGAAGETIAMFEISWWRPHASIWCIRAQDWSHEA